MTQQTLYTVTVYSENQVGLLNQISIIFTRRQLNIESLSVSGSAIEGVHKFTITTYSDRETMEKLVKQIEKRIDVLRAFFYTDDEIIFQEVALYKVPTDKLLDDRSIEDLIRKHNARILEVNRTYTVIEKSGHPDETQSLFEELSRYDVMQFVRSGRVAITKSTVEHVSIFLQEQHTDKTNYERKRRTIQTTNRTGLLQNLYRRAGRRKRPTGVAAHLLAKRILEVATLHAESWGVGYSTLIKNRQVWVLSRLTVEMYRYPLINEHYTLQTWIEGYNKHFSSRNFAILGEDGSPCGYARTIWVVIDLDSRTSVDISQFEYIAENISDKACPIEKQSRVRDVHDENAVIYPVTYNDIDLNRHVNSVKYIEHELDLFPFERYDKQRIRRFEISYANEARYGSTLQLLKEEEAPDHFTLEIRDDQTVYCKGRIIFENR